MKSKSVRSLDTGLDLEVGALVVYGSHGIGRVTARKPANTGQSPAECVTLEFDTGLAVTLPMERAIASLRALSGETDLVSVQEALRSTAAPEVKTWQERARNAQSKIATGRAVELAQVVSVSARRDHGPGARGHSLTTQERDLYLKARRLLAAEIGAARGTDEIHGDTWISEQLDQGGEEQLVA